MLTVELTAFSNRVMLDYFYTIRRIFMKLA